MSDTNEISKHVTDFLIAVGIAPGEQHPDYRLEIAYRMGYEDALRNYGIWRDGEQLIGAMQRPLREVLAEFKNKEVPLRY